MSSKWRCATFEPIFENVFAEHSYGFRPNRGAKDALRQVAHLLRSGRKWVVDADIKGYFDNIPQDQMMQALGEHISDGKVLGMIEQMLKKGVMESAKGWQPTEKGTPQGAVISPLLANVYLNALDHLMARRGWEMVRYADDFVILCFSQQEAETALEQVREWMENAGLTLHPTKTRIVNAAEKGGFDFLGYHFERGYRWPRQKSLEKFKETIRRKTPRLRPGGMKLIVEDINRTLRGLDISNTATGRNSVLWTDGYASVCAASSASDTRKLDVPVEAITSDGQMPISLNLG